MPTYSAGLLLYRDAENLGAPMEVLLVHPGGPFWANREHGAWSIPKGEYGADDDPAGCAAREFEEELGSTPPMGQGEWTDLGEVTQRGGKKVRAWAVKGDLDVTGVSSNTFEIEWPPRSGRHRSFPEVDRAKWMTPAEARGKINPAQIAFVDRLEELVTLTRPGGH